MKAGWCIHQRAAPILLGFHFTCSVSLSLRRFFPRSLAHQRTKTQRRKQPPEGAVGSLPHGGSSSACWCPLSPQAAARSMAPTWYYSVFYGGQMMCSCCQMVCNILKIPYKLFSVEFYRRLTHLLTQMTVFVQIHIFFLSSKLRDSESTI